MGYENQTLHDDELMHYGVLGMRWGVRRASKQLSRATDSETRNAAVNSLKKHKSKGEAKVASLEKKRVKLDDKLRKATTKDKVKATKLENKASKLDKKAFKLQKKATSWYASGDRANSLYTRGEIKKVKAEKLRIKSSVLNSNYEKVKARVDANESMQKAYKIQLNKIDHAITENGRRYING